MACLSLRIWWQIQKVWVARGGCSTRADEPGPQGRWQGRRQQRPHWQRHSPTAPGQDQPSVCGDGNQGQATVQLATKSIAMRQAWGQARKSSWQERVGSRSVRHRHSCHIGQAWTQGKGMNLDADPRSQLPPTEGWPWAAELQQSTGRN